jgi:15-cis-phytoene synthase
MGIRFLNKEIRNPIYAIYGFVRFADEIVDTFHDFDKLYLLDKFEKETFQAIEEKISLNPILNSFQFAVNKYNIDLDLVTTFLNSMRMDLQKDLYSQLEYEKYILGSAEVVGLMCLKVFVKGDVEMYNKLKFNAMRLGSAFQKINFLRDLNDDYQQLGRTYFPSVDLSQFDESTKKMIEKDIEKDFLDGYIGIKMLPKNASFGVYIAYVYYHKLFKKIQKTTPAAILKERVRLSNEKKYYLFVRTYLKHSLNLI